MADKFGVKVSLEINQSVSAQAHLRSEINKTVKAAVDSNPPKITKLAVDSKAITSAALQEAISKAAGQDGISVKLGKIDASSAIKNLRSEIQTMLDTLSGKGIKIVADGYQSSKSSGEISKNIAGQKEYNASLETTQKLLSSIKTQANSSLSAAIKIVDPSDVSTLGEVQTRYSEILDLIKFYSEYAKQTGDAIPASDVEKLGQVVSELSSVVSGYGKAQSTATEEEISFSNALKGKITQEEKEKTALISLQGEYTKITSLISQIDQYLNKNPNVANSAIGDQLKASVSSAKEFMDTMNADNDMLNSEKLPQATAHVSDLGNQFSTAKLQAKEFGIEGKSAIDLIKAAYSKFGGWMLVTQSIVQARQAISEMISAVEDVDSAMTELKKVTDETNTTYDKFLNTAAQTSKEIGSSVSDYVNATADFARLGYSITDAADMAKAASVYLNVGDDINSMDEATSSLISTIKAFGIEAENSMSIIDKFNEVIPCPFVLKIVYEQSA